jgi:hypothetical protein
MTKFAQPYFNNTVIGVEFLECADLYDRLTSSVRPAVKAWATAALGACVIDTGE